MLDNPKSFVKISQYMRIKRFKKQVKHKNSQIPPAEWQKFIEI